MFKQPVDGGNTVCWVSAHSRHVSLGFAEGVELLAADPSRLLMGSGKRQRHVKLTKLEQLEQPELADLIMAAWERQPRPEILAHGVDRLRALCFTLPQVVEVESHGHPTFKVGKKSFAVYGIYAPSLAFRADLSMHGRLAEDERFYPTPYMAKQGWLSIRLDEQTDWAEIQSLLEHSYLQAAGPKLRQQYRQGE